ncbi:putative efflux protein, MATE family [Alkalibacterium putridalgicola]|uniref:Probable multidrug resistance protein NorM n=1 Tax=Alkalibacterium putridalgicola TaxID=426703 RepID=A0A1H7UXZ5_9LACT|nr:MATE family efflux transporter [Alkalibacterium putridalgicola]GEK89564.1 MATE family efflux transporter [Alkalibacterium putridalgicola]SEM01832.1 putative efflux protein, MATE family [Alkalibacterium putridalgicola]
MKNMNSKKLGTMPMNRLILTLSVPMMISMFIQSLYNVVDSMFVAQISEDALAALSLVFPIQMLMVAIGIGTGVGMNAELSKRLGEDDRKLASAAANNGVFLTLFHYGIFLVFGLFFVRPFFEMQTDNSEIIRYGMEYTVLITTLSIGKLMQFTYERILQATGRTYYTMITQGTGAILNIILDPILIFGWFGVPALGVYGAAIATVIAQMTSATLAFVINSKVNDDLDMHIFGNKPDLKVIKRIYSVGIPSMVMTSITSLVTLIFNNILLQFTPTAIAVYGVYIKFQGFAFMPVFGLNNGMVPIVSYNFGARNKERMVNAIKLSLMYGGLIMLTGTLLFQIFPVQFLNLFSASDEMLRIGVPALRTISLSFVFAGISIMLGTVFQAIGNAVISLWIQVIRQLLVLVPVAYALSLTGDVNMVWWSKLISESVTVVFAVMAMRFIYKKKIEPLK